MASRTRRVRCIVLDATKLREQDLILTALADDGSQVRAVAKGARKPGGRLASKSELFCVDDLLLARGRGALEVVSEAELVDAHAAIRGDYERVCAASAVCETARLTCFEGASDPYLYAICARALTAVEEAGAPETLSVVVAAHALKVLAHEGWMPALDACVLCGEPSGGWFSAEAGGVLCDSCARGAEGALPVTDNDAAWLRALLRLTFDELLAAPCDRRTADRLLELAHLWCVRHLDARMRAWEYLRGA